MQQRFARVFGMQATCKQVAGFRVKDLRLGVCQITTCLEYSVFFMLVTSEIQGQRTGRAFLLSEPRRLSSQRCG